MEYTTADVKERKKVTYFSETSLYVDAEICWLQIYTHAACKSYKFHVPSSSKLIKSQNVNL